MTVLFTSIAGDFFGEKETLYASQDFEVILLIGQILLNRGDVSVEKNSFGGNCQFRVPSSQIRADQRR